MILPIRKRMRRTRDRSGFTLLELSLVLVIMAVLMGGGAGMLVSSLAKRQVRGKQQEKDAIKKALLVSRQAFMRTPCPADVTLNMTDADFGQAASIPGDCYSTGSIKANFSQGNNV